MDGACSSFWRTWDERCMCTQRLQRESGSKAAHTQTRLFFNINFRLFLTTVPVAYTAVCN